jgi:exopolysaccharide biosynthesis polyprenyl glycosylphosphotransferase
MTDQKSRLLRRLLLILDLCLVTFTLIVVSSFHQTNVFVETYSFPTLHMVILLAPSIVFFMHFYGAYKRFKPLIWSRHSLLVAKALTSALFVALLFIFLIQSYSADRSLVSIFFISTFFLLILNRWFLVWWYFHYAVERESNYLKVLIIGAGDRACRLARELESHLEWGVSVVGHLDTNIESVGKSIGGSKVLGTVDQISEILRHNVVEEVILALPRSKINEVAMIANACEEEGVQLLIMGDLYEINASRISFRKLGAIPMLHFDPVALDTDKQVIKRLFDIVLTLLAMPVIAPVMGAIALAIKLDDGGPIFFIQQRIGFHKRRFPMVKFRSMCVGAEAKMKEMEHLNEASGPIFKIKKDPRVTKVGSFLRKTSLDELPQLFNVLRGHMSLIGPRPMSLRDVELFDHGLQRKRFSVRPGLTCIWQVSGRSNLPFDQWLALDLEYIENWSLWLDIKILFKTIPAVMRGQGAT